MMGSGMLIENKVLENTFFFKHNNILMGILRLINLSRVDGKYKMVFILQGSLKTLSLLKKVTGSTDLKHRLKLYIFNKI